LPEAVIDKKVKLDSSATPWREAMGPRQSYADQKAADVARCGEQPASSRPRLLAAR